MNSLRRGADELSAVGGPPFQMSRVSPVTLAVSVSRYWRGENVSGMSNVASTEQNQAKSKPAMSALNISLAI